MSKIEKPQSSDNKGNIPMKDLDKYEGRIVGEFPLILHKNARKGDSVIVHFEIDDDMRIFCTCVNKKTNETVRKEFTPIFD